MISRDMFICSAVLAAIQAGTPKGLDYISEASKLLADELEKQGVKFEKETDPPISEVLDKEDLAQLINILHYLKAPGTNGNHHVPFIEYFIKKLERVVK